MSEMLFMWAIDCRSGQCMEIKSLTQVFIVLSHGYTRVACELLDRLL